MEDNNNEIKTSTLAWWIVGVLLLSIIIVSSTRLLLKDWQTSGTFGDTFGAVNAIFSGLAFLGIIYTILLQRSELVLQRNELELTRNELEGQKKEFEKQNETLSLQHETLIHQQFENTFFNLLSMFNELRNNMEYRQNHTSTIKGIPYFIMSKSFLKNAYDSIHRDIEQNKHHTDRLQKKYNIYDVNTLSDIDVMPRAAYVYMSNQEHINLENYFRSLYSILNYIWLKELEELAVNSTVNRNDKLAKKLIDENIHRKYKQYTQFIQAQMSSSELVLLFYNALFFPKMKRFLYHYDLIENLSTEDLLDPVHDINFYSGDTFGSYTYQRIDLKSKKQILKP